MADTPAETVAAAWPNTDGGRRHNLPAQPTALIGREWEIANVCALLRRPDVRLVTLTGPGGTGKTRLALQVAAELLDQFPVGAVHHVALSVSDLDRAVQFYTELLGFEQIAEFAPKRILSNGSLILGIGPAQQGDRFDENRTGLDHLSFSVSSRADLARAVELLDARGVPHGEITELEPFQIVILAFRDPDNIQLELTAPYNA